MKILESIALLFRRCAAAQVRISEHFETAKKVIDPQTLRVMKFNRAGGNDLLFRGHDLNSDSLVFDIGGFRGDWAAEIFVRYSPEIKIFEPVPEFTNKLRQRFQGNSKITVYPFGLGGQNQETTLYSHDDRSSLYQQEGEPIQVSIKRISEFLAAEQKSAIDLMKINIEGAEYELLDDLIQSGFMASVRLVQVQFHDFVENAEPRMTALQELLARTHQLTMHHKFVWENWTIQENKLRQPSEVIAERNGQSNPEQQQDQNRRKAG
jgi:FkbM family methyltransferase